MMQNDEQLAEELERATAGLSFMSESDYPFQVVRWDAGQAITQTYLRSLTKEPQDAQVSTESLEDFFGPALALPDWKGEAERATVHRYQTLVQYLRDNLEDVKVYKVGRINMPVYIVGRSPTGTWLGLSTRVVET